MTTAADGWGGMKTATLQTDARSCMRGLFFACDPAKQSDCGQARGTQCGDCRTTYRSYKWNRQHAPWHSFRPGYVEFAVRWPVCTTDLSYTANTAASEKTHLERDMELDSQVINPAV